MRIVTFEVWLVKLREPVELEVEMGALVFPMMSSRGPSSFPSGLSIEAFARMRKRVSSIERLAEVGGTGADAVYAGGSIAT